MDEKILVRGVNWIGDAVMTLPALRAVRKAYPDSHLGLLVKPFVAPIFEKNPSVDEIILYEKGFEGIIGKFKLARRLRKARFSKAILFQNAFDAALISYLAGIPERIGYERDGRGKLLTEPVPFNNDDKKIHHVDYYLNLLRASGINAEHSFPWIYLSLEERLAARDDLGRLRRPILGMNPGAAYGSAKRWLPDRFAEVANWFMKDTNGSVVIFGGRDETHIAQEIEKSAWIQEPERRELTALSLLNLAGNTSLRDLISLISECNLFLGNDSGPMHIAYAVGTPLVALFGSTEPNLTGPLGEGNAVIKHVLPCSPCFERTCKADDLRCMDEITSDEVYLSLKKIMPDKPAVFFDRDGTLCEDMNYLKSRDDFRLLPGVGNLARLKAAGLMLIGVTNQSGVARGLVGEGFVREINNLFIKEFGFDGFFYCPHHPEEHCPCRKPEPGMINDARHTYGIDPRKSYVVGDKEADMLLARAVGARGILIRTGQQKDSPHADFVAEGLREAVDLIMKNERI